MKEGLTFLLTRRLHIWRRFSKASSDDAIGRMDFGSCKRDSWSKLVFEHRLKARGYVRSLQIKMG